MNFLSLPLLTNFLAFPAHDLDQEGTSASSSASSNSTDCALVELPDFPLESSAFLVEAFRNHETMNAGAHAQQKSLQKVNFPFLRSTVEARQESAGIAVDSAHLSFFTGDVNALIKIATHQDLEEALASPEAKAERAEERKLASKVGNFTFYTVDAPFDAFQVGEVVKFTTLNNQQHFAAFAAALAAGDFQGKAPFKTKSGYFPAEEDAVAYSQVAGIFTNPQAPTTVVLALTDYLYANDFFTYLLKEGALEAKQEDSSKASLYINAVSYMIGPPASKGDLSKLLHYAYNHQLEDCWLYDFDVKTFPQDYPALPNVKQYINNPSALCSAIIPLLDSEDFLFMVFRNFGGEQLGLGEFDGDLFNVVFEFKEVKLISKEEVSYQALMNR